MGGRMYQVLHQENIFEGYFNSRERRSFSCLTSIYLILMHTLKLELQKSEVRQAEFSIMPKHRDLRVAIWKDNFVSTLALIL